MRNDSQSNSVNTHAQLALGTLVSGVVVGKDPNNESKPPIQHTYTVQYADYVTTEGLSREDLPRSSLISQHYWPQKATVTVKDLNDAIPDKSDFKTSFKAQHTLIQKRLDEASREKSGYSLRLTIGAKTAPVAGRTIVPRSKKDSPEEDDGKKPKPPATPGP